MKLLGCFLRLLVLLLPALSLAFPASEDINREAPELRERVDDQIDARSFNDDGAATRHLARSASDAKSKRAESYQHSPQDIRLRDSSPQVNGSGLALNGSDSGWDPDDPDAPGWDPDHDHDTYRFHAEIKIPLTFDQVEVILQGELEKNLNILCEVLVKITVFEYDCGSVRGNLLDGLDLKPYIPGVITLDSRLYIERLSSDPQTGYVHWKVQGKVHIPWPWNKWKPINLNKRLFKIPFKLPKPSYSSSGTLNSTNASVGSPTIATPEPINSIAVS